MVSDATKKEPWSRTRYFKATRDPSAANVPKNILTFIDCLLIHPNSTFTGDVLFLPIPNRNQQKRENSKKYCIVMGEERERSEQETEFRRHDRRMQWGDVLCGTGYVTMEAERMKVSCSEEIEIESQGLLPNLGD
ncbi:hypothetical protein SLA2020_000800 [Shorea laevis]